MDIAHDVNSGLQENLIVSEMVHDRNKVNIQYYTKPLSLFQIP